ncbi:hypothetical protein AWH56_003300 [Anaerobacillus isosaccharinicus]|uniref:Uncharacterized protein n=1 Tax=Anaerobacillus isosaccharinicus TaxID=1532552 RepID=A0A1S2L4J7_9BACI|nr:hypothetical protein [Anaerobacillus isosaccharinicus]MBA5584948.1 hypothetical protein [Anaerobacillus isosaccharinicus]QOY36696.1 hypothetical protein AWH56_003300 [Anaerobacillus isosaccharinicus]
MSTLQKSFTYGFAFLFTLLIHVIFVLPIGLPEPLQNHTHLYGLVFITLLVFPLLMARTLIKKGKRSLYISLPFYIAGLLLLYRGFYLEDQFSIIDFLFMKIEGTHGDFEGDYGSFLGLESFFLYIVVCEFGVLLSFFQNKQGKN